MIRGTEIDGIALVEGRDCPYWTAQVSPLKAELGTCDLVGTIGGRKTFDILIKEGHQTGQ
jgi:hypothetical protein